eukprot:CAMPEP_0172564766 /NCGR_PEP_ID=MMETSP1067-20121228/105666_1 /TAXON_ID=265564 ORGANISM="Thalassiosira punctigera, Strain Tpunct2005C2" /NCGR_SAMPLE_ID=MMETSP1067 /ASSEMBLY_ACC=CAM_ASM_000444 /LENGTH=70 /DNA_ID=CAMNT_0013355515 /DNA_START=162 /DNA_END=371 /DNA_ORIENTATION=+
MNAVFREAPERLENDAADGLPPPSSSSPFERPDIFAAGKINTKPSYETTRNNGNGNGRNDENENNGGNGG